MIYFTKDSKLVRLGDHEGWLNVSKDDRGCNTKPYTVMLHATGKTFAQQVAPWYTYRGNAERWLKRRIAKGDLTIIAG